MLMLNGKVYLLVCVVIIITASKRSALSLQPKIPATKAPIKTTTDDTPDFDRGKVSLEIPDPLFVSSFSTVTNVSKIFGDLIMEFHKSATTVLHNRGVQLDEVRRIIRAETERNYVRQAFFTTLGNIKRLFDDQYNETTNALQRVLDLVKDGFSDTATKKPKPPVEETTTLKPNETISTTTERQYSLRDYRREFGNALEPYSILKTSKRNNKT